MAGAGKSAKIESVMTSARASILTAAMSGELRGALQALELQLAEEIGPARARERVVRVAASLATGKRDFITRACVFFWAAAAHCGVDMIDLLARGTAPARACRAFFRDGGGPFGVGGFLQVGADALRFADAEDAYEIPFARAPFLLSYSAFIVNFAGYAIFQQARNDAVVERSVKGVSTCARHLANDLNRRLGVDMPTGHGMGKHHFIIEFFEERVGRDFVMDDVDDESVFDLWRAALVEAREDQGLTRFVSCAEAVVAFLSLWDEGAAALRLDGADEFVGEMRGRRAPDDDVLGASLLAMLAPDDVCERFSDLIGVMVASSLNCLTDEQVKRLSAFFMYPDAARALGLTRLRAFCLGPLQGRVSKAGGRKGGARRLAELISEPPRQNYEKISMLTKKALEDLEKALWAVGHILLVHRRPAAATHLLALADPRDLMADGLGGVVRDRASAGRVLDAAEAAIASGVEPPLLRPLAARAERAFRALAGARKGFEKEALLLDETRVSAERIAEACQGEAPALARRRAAFDETLRRASFDADCVIFREALSAYYLPPEEHSS